jgi:sialate O-acetylesterase
MSINQKVVKRTVMLKSRLLLGATFLLLVSPALCCAHVTLPDVISSGMVLQRGVAVPIWGKADPGEKVTVKFGSQTQTTTADGSGRWRVFLKPLKANATPETMEISGTISGKTKDHSSLDLTTILLQDVLVGEVWLVAGQSNMQWRLGDSNGGEVAIAAANYPTIRLFNVSREVGFKRKPPPLATWRASTPMSARDFSAAGFYFGLELQRELKVPIGLINSSYGGSQAEAWTPEEYLLASADLRPTVERTKIWEAERPRVKAEYEERIKQWRAASENATEKGARPQPSPSVPDALRDYRIAASIYRGMIEPLIPFAIRGAIWYQGESNEGRAQQYGILLPTMIRAWRERWGQGDFPFGIVQLPNYKALKANPTDDPWSHIREAQRRTALATRNAGLIVTIDIGEANDIHPRNKLDVGRRMALWALADAYGRKITKSGPTFRAARTAGEKIVVTFSDVGTGLRIRSGDKLQEFAIAGEDGKWHWAEARIIGKDKVEVWSSAVQKPLAVRYAFNDNPKQPNLTNDTGLPASPFRSDNWAGPTDGKR